MKGHILALALSVFAAGVVHQTAPPAHATEVREARSVAAEPATIARGQAVFRRWCAPCHGKGLNMPGTTALDAKYLGKVPAALEDRSDFDAVAIGYFVRNGISIMPTFRKTEISDAELADLSLYLGRNRRD